MYVYLFAFLVISIKHLGMLPHTPRYAINENYKILYYFIITPHKVHEVPSVNKIKYFLKNYLF